MTVDVNLLARLAARDPAAVVEEHYGAAGMAALRRLISGLDAIGRQLAFEMLGGGLTVMAALDPTETLLPTGESAIVRPEQLPALVNGAGGIEIAPDGLRLSKTPIDPIACAHRAVVYHFDGADNLVIAGALLRLENPTTFSSRWQAPTFFDLREALEHYQTAIAPVTRCPYLRAVWHDPDRRWLFKNKPEATLQDSLEQHLVSSLRLGRVEVRREQPIGGRKPPDIKVTWSQTNRLAFVEVKWMGASVHATEPRISWRPEIEEAKAGARQLADYLDENAQEAPEHQTMGFLVVFDGRREGVDYSTKEITREQAMSYAASDVLYDPDYAAQRHDFSEPLRCFMLPLQPPV